MIILCHVSDKRLRVLKPNGKDNCIYFSQNKFISYFGQYLYLFDLDVLKANFRIKKKVTGSLIGTLECPLPIKSYWKYKSQSLKWEWRVYDPINVKEFSIGVVEHWNYTKGTFETYDFSGDLMKWAVDLSENNKTVMKGDNNMDAKALKTKYNALSITQIEHLFMKSKKTLAENDKAGVELLFYLELTKRYKENPRYKNSPFKVYLLDVFGIRYNAYYDKRIAYFNFEKEAMEHGTGLITRIKNKCGVGKLKTVLTEIKKKDSVLKKPIKREQIADIIHVYSKPVPEKKERLDVKDFERRIDLSSQELNDAYRIIKAKDKQIIKLKGTIYELKKELERYQELYQAIEPFMIPDVGRDESRFANVG